MLIYPLKLAADVKLHLDNPYSHWVDMSPVSKKDNLLLLDTMSYYSQDFFFGGGEGCRTSKWTSGPKQWTSIDLILSKIVFTNFFTPFDI